VNILGSVAFKEITLFEMKEAFDDFQERLDRPMYIGLARGQKTVLSNVVRG